MTTEIYYFWKIETGNNWIGFSIAHNKKEEKIIEKVIKKNIKLKRQNSNAVKMGLIERGKLKR